MKKKFLLGLTLLASVFASAKTADYVLNEDFSNQPGDDSTVPGWYEFINLKSGEVESDSFKVEGGQLHIVNLPEFEGASWERAIKFRNLNIEENSSYKVSFNLYGSNTYMKDGAEQKCKAVFALGQGVENCERAFFDQNGQEQTKEISYFVTPEQVETGLKEPEHYEMIFHHGTKAYQEQCYQASKQSWDTGETLPQTYLFRINCYNPGEFFIDDIKIEKVNSLNLYWNQYDIVKLDFGQPINGDELCAGKPAAYLPTDMVSASYSAYEGDYTGEAPIASLEARQDGTLWLYFDLDADDDFTAALDDEAIDSICVSFNNETETVKYAKTALFTGAVKSFDNMAVVANSEISYPNSYKSDVPSIAKIEPEAGSFNLPLDSKTIKVTFDKPALVSKMEATLAGKPVAITTTDEFSEVVEFNIDGAIAEAGTVTFSITKIYPESYDAQTKPGSYSCKLAYGPVPEGEEVETIFEDDLADILTATNYDNSLITMYNDDAVNTGTGSGCRPIGSSIPGLKNGVFAYVGHREGNGWMTFGEKDGKELCLKPGNYELSALYGGWDGNQVGAMQVSVYRKDAPDEVIYTEYVEAKFNVPNTASKTFVGAPQFKGSFEVESADNYVVKIYPRGEGNTDLAGFTAIAIGDIMLQSIPSALGVKEVNEVRMSLAAAQTCYEQNNTERYEGEGIDELKAAIDDCDFSKLNAPSLCTAMKNRLDAAVLAVGNHVALCNKYDELVPQITSAREGLTDTKFEATESYPKAVAAEEKYVGQVLKNDNELSTAISELTVAIKGCNAAKVLTDNLLFDTKKAIETVKTFNKGIAEEFETIVNDTYLEADSTTLKTLRGEVKHQIYKAIVDGDDPFMDANLEPAKIDLTCMIDNSELFYSAYADNAEASLQQLPSSENLPCWSITEGSGWAGGFRYHYPWGGNKDYSYDPQGVTYADGMVVSWAYAYNLSQELTDLPVGYYTLGCSASARGAAEKQSYAYAVTSEIEEDPVTLDSVNKVYMSEAAPNKGGGSEPSNDGCIVENIYVSDGYLKIGFKCAGDDLPFCNNFHLYMTDKDPNYDYTGVGIVEKANKALAGKTVKYTKNGKVYVKTANGLYNAVGVQVK